MEVRIEHLTKVFPGRKKSDKGVAAVNDMSFVIPDGKLIGLLGPSGCGKSTTLYMIAGLHKPTGGKIFFGDDEVTHLPPENRGIGLVFQNYALYPHFTVGKNIRFPLDNIRPAISKEDKDVIVHEMARLVDIEPYLDRKPKELSGGQQQRVAIARALAKSPRVLLLDEPLSNLDARLRLQTREEIKRIQRETNITTVFVTHDQEEAMSISDLIVVMKEGVIQQIDEPQKVYDNPANLFVAKFLGSPAINIFEGEVKKNKLYVNGKLFSEDPAFTKPLRTITVEEIVVKEEVKVPSPIALDGEVLSDGKDSEAIATALSNYQGLGHADLTAQSRVELSYVIRKNKIVPLDADGNDISEENGRDGLIEVIKGILQGVPAKDNTLTHHVRYKIGTELADVVKTIETVEETFDRRVVIAVRPDAFVIDPNGLIQVKIDYVEHIGRDISCVGSFVDGAEEQHHAKIIIPSENSSKIKGSDAKFSLKRYHVFDYNGDRVF